MWQKHLAADRTRNEASNASSHLCTASCRTGPAPVSPLQGGDGLASPPTAAPRPMEAPPAKKRSLAAAFSSAEEEDQPKRRLIPLQYTAAELKAAQAANAAAAGANP